jgi:hypothetical protein
MGEGCVRVFTLLLARFVAVILLMLAFVAAWQWFRSWRRSWGRFDLWLLIACLLALVFFFFAIIAALGSMGWLRLLEASLLAFTFLFFTLIAALGSMTWLWLFVAIRFAVVIFLSALGAAHWLGIRCRLRLFVTSFLTILFLFPTVVAALGSMTWLRLRLLPAGLPAFIFIFFAVVATNRFWLWLLITGFLAAGIMIFAIIAADRLPEWLDAFVVAFVRLFVLFAFSADDSLLGDLNNYAKLCAILVVLLAGRAMWPTGRFEEESGFHAFGRYILLPLVPRVLCYRVAILVTLDPFAFDTNFFCLGSRFVLVGEC